MRSLFSFRFDPECAERRYGCNLYRVEILRAPDVQRSEQQRSRKRVQQTHPDASFRPPT